MWEASEKRIFASKKRIFASGTDASEASEGVRDLFSKQGLFSDFSGLTRGSNKKNDGKS